MASFQSSPPNFFCRAWDWAPDPAALMWSWRDKDDTGCEAEASRAVDEVAGDTRLPLEWRARYVPGSERRGRFDSAAFEGGLSNG